MLILLQQVDVRSDCLIVVDPAESSKSKMYYVLQQLKQDLPKVPIKVRLHSSSVHSIELRKRFYITYIVYF